MNHFGFGGGRGAKSEGNEDGDPKPQRVIPKQPRVKTEPINKLETKANIIPLAPELPKPEEGGSKS